jgi:apolipoprotein N-acyltransferase
MSDQLPWLQRVFAFSGPVGISAGEEIHYFNVNGTRFAPLICFEDTVPQLVREVVAAGESQGADVDCLVNLTNDGWFHGSSELEQHLITASFRCIETRTPMVRAVNTGISAVIDGDGLVREPEKFIDYDALRDGDRSRSSMRDPETGEYHKQLNAALIGYVPLDARSSWYTRFGDWFATLCAAMCCVAAVSSRWLPAPAPEPTRAP